MAEFLIGLFIGAMIGIIIMALFTVSKENDKPNGKDWEG